MTVILRRERRRPLPAPEPRRTTARISTRPGPHPSRPALLPISGKPEIGARAPQDDGVRHHSTHWVPACAGTNGGRCACRFLGSSPPLSPRPL